MEEMTDPPVIRIDDSDDDEEDQTSNLYDDDEKDETSDLDDEEHNKIKNFMKDLPSEVSFRRPSSKRELWTFWSGGSISDSATHTPTTNQPIITDIIKSALLHFIQSYCMGNLLIQFWAPITAETGCVQLVTSDQPFAVSYELDERLLNYRKQCLQYKFNVDGEQLEHLGIPGRVFHQKWHECIPDVRHYSTKEYPQRDFALTCHISNCFSFPVFQTSFQDCVGVVEFAATSNYDLYFTHDWFLKDELKRAGLETCVCDGVIRKFQDLFIDDGDILAEIDKGLEVVCQTHNLPFAKTWIPCNHFNGSYTGQVFHRECKASYLLDDHLEDFYYGQNNLQKGQGVVGSAYQSLSVA
ncbi:protein NLP6-like [Cornus florida]|uniref:protein NLP6-like n=1 Tax=Cornus florida TaxID=4283 RepID=UPI00289B55AF|nr:protein NLP6-like [Cornus florida]